MTKEEVYKKIDSEAQTHYTKAQIKNFINVVQFSLNKPKYFKKGDVISYRVGEKKRPCVVIKVYSDVLYSLSLSTTKDELNLCESKSRFWCDGYFSKGVVVIKKEFAEESFLGVYDNPKLLNKAIKLMKQEVSYV